MSTKASSLNKSQRWSGGSSNVSHRYPFHDLRGLTTIVSWEPSSPASVVLAPYEATFFSETPIMNTSSLGLLVTSLGAPSENSFPFLSTRDHAGGIAEIYHYSTQGLLGGGGALASLPLQITQRVRYLVGPLSPLYSPCSSRVPLRHSGVGITPSLQPFREEVGSGSVFSTPYFKCGRGSHGPDVGAHSAGRLALWLLSPTPSSMAQ